MNARRQPIIFCDFDGTITENDNIIAIMKHFRPEGWEQTVKDTIERRISVREGVGALFARLPTSRKDEIVAYAVSNAKIRAGFAELLAWCKRENVPFLVTSGGIDFFVHPLLAPFGIPESDIYCNASDFGGETIRIVWPHPCGPDCSNDCGLCKPRIIRDYPAETHYRILIGDSVTDFEGAKLADLVFARSHLLDRCRETGIDAVPYETFFDVVSYLQSAMIKTR